MIRRHRHIAEVQRLLRQFRVVGVLGARQVGKTTLARQVSGGRRAEVHHFDLEDPADLGRLEDARTTLDALGGLVVLDEIQRRPNLFEVLRVLADRPGGARFLVLGSASPALLRQSSETLAGRIAYHELTPFTLDEVGARALDRLWFRGGFPPSFTARNDGESARWRREFTRTFLERELPPLEIGVPPATLRRFWAMLAHYHAQRWNSAELARALAVSESSIRRYLDVLAGTYLIRVLAPWHENLGKRQVKAPKVYVADAGLLHALLDIESPEILERHPKVGASWEGFAFGCLAAALRARPEQLYFWATHTGAELDLLLIRGNERRGFEIKRTSAPSVTPSMRIALEDLHLDSLDVVHSGKETYRLAPRIRAVALRRVLTDL